MDAMGTRTWKAYAALRVIGTNFGLDLADDSALLTEQGVQLAPGRMVGLRFCSFDFR